MSSLHDRRAVTRVRTVFMPSCIIRNRRVDYAIMRDRSEDGARFSAPAPFKVGERLQYKTGDSQTRNGIVRWAKGGEFGVSHLESASQSDVTEKYNYRSVRVPFQFPTRLFTQGRVRDTQLVNISQMGGCIEGSGAMAVGSLVTLRLFGLSLEAASVKWTDGDLTGLKWARPINCAGLAYLLDVIQSGGTNMSCDSKMFAG